MEAANKVPREKGKCLNQEDDGGVAFGQGSKCAGDSAVS